MKPYAALLGLSITVNLGLIVAFVVKPGLAPPAVREFLSSSSAREERATARARDRSVEEKRLAEAGKRESAPTDNRAQLWAALDSDDLPTLVKRLRAAGFSRPVILGILNARIEARFADRFKALTSDLESTPYWKPDPMNSPGNTKYWEEYSQIYRERSRMLRELLGEDSFAYAGTDPATAQRRQFGSIPKEKIDLVQRINDDYAEMTSQIRASMQGITLPEDREKLALLEREKRADLAAVLSPAELEEYEMRSSQVTSRLRNTLSIMDASEAEFRAIFKVQQAFNDRVNPVMSGMISSQMMEDRREAQKLMNEQLKTVLSPERFNDFMRSSNSEYQILHRLAQKENVPAETVTRAYSIRDGIAAESVRIADDTALSNEQKRAALTALAQKGRTQILSTLGPGIGETYAQSARWLTTIERGAGVIFGPDGNPMPRTIINPPRP
jgi:hypothetical protein